MSKRKDKAVQHFQELLLQDQHDVIARFGLAKRLTELKKFDKASKHLQTILLEKPNHQNALNLQTQIETAQEQAKAKIQQITSAAKKSFAQSHPEGGAAEEDDEDKLEEIGGEDTTSTAPIMSTYPNGAAADNTGEEKTELTGNFEDWELIELQT